MDNTREYPNSLSAGEGALSTGLPGVDGILGTCGLPRGRIVELYGPAGCGKTTLALHWLRAAQQAGATVVYVDVERALDLNWASACGLDLHELAILKPDNGQQALAMIENLLRTFSVDLVVIDSVAAMIAPEELEAELSDVNPGLQTEFLYNALRRLQALALRGRCALVFLNQLRSGGQDQPEYSACGRALALHAAIRIRMHPIPAASGMVALETIKNKLADPFLQARLQLRGPQVIDPSRTVTPDASGWVESRSAGSGR